MLNQHVYMHELAPVGLIVRAGGEHRISNPLLWQTAYAGLYFTDALWLDFDGQDFEGALDAFADRERRFGGIEPGDRIAWWGSLLLEYRLISAFVLISVVITALFLLPPVGFAIVTLVVCILAAWEWRQLSGFTTRSQRVWLAVLYGLLLTPMLFLLPEYHRNIHQPLVEISSWALLGWWIIALLPALFYPGSATIWRSSKALRLISGVLAIVPFFWGMLALWVWHYDENHYNGAMWLLYVMILVRGVDPGTYMLDKLFGEHKLVPKVSPDETWQGFIGGLTIVAVISWGYGMWANPDVVPATLLICSTAAALTSVLSDLTENMFKRETGVKDSGHLIPRYSGILDCIDSLTAAVPVFAYLLLLIFRTP